MSNCVNGMDKTSSFQCQIIPEWK